MKLTKEYHHIWYHHKGGAAKNRIYKLRHRAKQGLPPPREYRRHESVDACKEYHVAKIRAKRHAAAIAAGRVPGKVGRPKATKG